jgi:hypothetical protein
MTSETDSVEPADAQHVVREAKPNASLPVTRESTEQWQAALSVMHPEASDPDWRQYHAAWGG